MKKISKKLIAFLCAVALIIGMIPMGIIPVQAQTTQEEATYKKVLHSCDSKNAVTENSNTYTTSGTATTDLKYVEEGTGSLGVKRATAGAQQFAYIYLDEMVDVNGYETFSCKIYVDGRDNLFVNSSNNQVLRINLYTDYAASSAGQLIFKVLGSQLSEGWNTLTLSFADALSVGESYNGKVKLVTFQTMGAPSADTQFYFDDICVRNENEGLLIADCDQTAKSTKLVTIGDGNWDSTNTDKVEGTGAWKSKSYASGNNYRLQMTFTLTNMGTLDISDYMSSGYLHLWLYVENQENLSNGFNIVLSSEKTQMITR